MPSSEPPAGVGPGSATVVISSAHVPEELDDEVEEADELDDEAEVPVVEGLWLAEPLGESSSAFGGGLDGG